MKKMFHRGYFLELFRQLKTPGIVLASVLMLMNLIPLFSNGTSLMSQTLTSIPNESTMAVTMMWYVYISSLVLTFIGFNWLNHRSTSDFYHALPIKRAQIYWSTLLAIVLWMVIGHTAYAVVHACLYLATGMPFNYLSFLCVYLNMLIGALYVVGIVALSCAISGTRFVNLFAAAAILLMPRILLMVLAGFTAQKAPNVSVMKLSFLFDPSYNLFATPYMVIVGMIDQDISCFHNVFAMLYSLLHAALIAFLGCVAFKRRPSESAGMPMRSRLLQGLIRTAFGLPLLLILAYLIVSETYTLSMIVILIVFAFTFYCLYELISTKSAKRMVKAMPLFSICIGIAALYLFIPMLIGRATRAVVADENNITAFTLTNESHDYPTMLINDVKITDPEGIKIVSDAYRRTMNNDVIDKYETMTVRIHRKGRLPIERELAFTSYEQLELQMLLEKDDTYREKAAAFPHGICYFSAPGLTLSESREIGLLFAEEYNALSDRERTEIKAQASWYDGDSAFSRSYYILTVRGTCGVRSFHQRYAILDLTPKTAQRYAELLYQKANLNADDKLERYLAWMETGEGECGTVCIGNNTRMILYNTMWAYDKPESTPKDADPEYYEILMMLKNAESTQNVNEGVTVTFGEYGYDTYIYESAIYSFYETVPECRFFRLTDEQIARIEELIEQHDQRLYEAGYDKF